MKADLLSRRHDLEKGENDNKDVTLLPPQFFRLMETQIEGEDEELIQKIREGSKEGTTNLDEVVEESLRQGKKGWELKEGIVLVEGRIYVPKQDELREHIIRLNHNVPLAGHPGRHKTYELITRNYWWPRLTWDVKEYVKGCEACQRTKHHRERKYSPLKPHQAALFPFEHITVDFIGPVEESQGFNTILVVVDKHSKYVILIPTNTKLSAYGTARLFRDQVFKNFGLPRKITSDRGPQFSAKFMKDLYTLLGIEGNLSTGYHPQTDGQTEQMNQEIEGYLRIYINHRQSDWAEWLPTAQFAINNHQASATQQSPFYVVLGQHPYTGSNPRTQVNNPEATQLAEEIHKVREEVTSHIKKTIESMRKQYDKKRKPSRKYKVGDLVWIEGTNIKTDRPTKKFADLRNGPAPILQIIGNGAYELELPPTWKKVHPVFHKDLLSPFYRAKFPSQKLPRQPPPALVNKQGELEWEIEKIHNVKELRGTLKYLIEWKGYPKKTEWGWEPLSNLLNADEALEDFYANHPTAPKQVNRVLAHQLCGEIAGGSTDLPRLRSLMRQCITEPMTSTDDINDDNELDEGIRSLSFDWQPSKNTILSSPQCNRRLFSC